MNMYGGDRKRQMLYYAKLSLDLITRTSSSIYENMNGITHRSSDTWRSKVDSTDM